MLIFCGKKGAREEGAKVEASGIAGEDLIEQKPKGLVEVI